MGRYHSPYLMALFPDQVATGIDLGNIELKESLNSDHKFIIKPKDMFAEFFLFYDHALEEFFFCDLQDLPVIKKTRSILLNRIEKICLWRSKDEIEVLTKVEQVMRFD